MGLLLLLLRLVGMVGWCGSTYHRRRHLTRWEVGMVVAMYVVTV